MEPIAYRIKWLGRGSKKVELPIPFVQKCEKTGEVICDPVGEFPYEDGMKLLEVGGGMFKLAEGEKTDSPTETKSAVEEPKYYDHLCACGCGGKIEVKASHKHTAIPKYLKHHFKPSAAKKLNTEAPSSAES